MRGQALCYEVMGVRPEHKDQGSPDIRRMWTVLAHFHRRVRVVSVCKGAARVVFPPPKVGMTRAEPY